MEKYLVTNGSEETEKDARSLLLDGRLQTTPLFKDPDITCSLLVWTPELYCFTGRFTRRPNGRRHAYCSSLERAHGAGNGATRK
jgi:hypothetical protein